MSDQRTFAGLAWTNKGKVTRRERFLAEMDDVIPWQRLVGLVEPYYPKAGRGRRPMGVEKMLRIYFLQHWFNLSDPGAEEALYDSESMRRFARIELGEEAVPDESTILHFRHLLEEHRLTEAMLVEVNALLESKGLLLKSGTIVDATIIEAAPSTKNESKARDPEMKQTRKGKNWHFGLKLHTGTDPRGIVHSVSVTHAATSDLQELGCLLHGEERELYGDQAYWSAPLREQCEAAGIRYLVNYRPARKALLTEEMRRSNRERSRTRAMGEHPYQVLKHLWGFRKVRYRGLEKNRVHIYAALTLVNLYRMRRSLRPHRAKCLL